MEVTPEKAEESADPQEVFLKTRIRLGRLLQEYRSTRFVACFGYTTIMERNAALDRMYLAALSKLHYHLRVQGPSWADEVREVADEFAFNAFCICTGMVE